MRTLGLGGAAMACTAVARPVWAEAATHAPVPAGVVAPHGCDVLLLTCMDFRLQNETVAYMDRRGLRDNYDHVVLAGASLGVLTQERPDWGLTFWDHLDTAIKLHGIRKVMVIDHLDCGAYKVFVGEAVMKDPAAELVAHGQRLRLLRSAINVQNAMLEVELGIMALDGTVQTVT
ncbi:MAG TPA: carbonic anhydrase [Caulobacteraceae bacterium]|jgi:hypothetical protein|nr:carbonic anhydrase [Caulobacteraceae bacterium]